MKILIASNYLPGYHRIWSGAEIATKRNSELLAKKGHEVTVLTTKPVKKMEESFSTAWIDAKISNWKWRGASIDMKAKKESYRIFKDINPDVINLNNFEQLSFSIIDSAKKLKIPVVFSVYDLWMFCPVSTLNKNGKLCKSFTSMECLNCLPGKFKPFVPLLKIRKKIMDHYIKKIDKFIVLCKEYKEILSCYGIAENKIDIIPLPKPEIKVRAIKNKKDIFFAGFVEERKGCLDLVRSMEYIEKNHPESRLHIIGDSAENEYKDLVEKEAHGHKVSFYGKLPNNDTMRIMQKCSVVAYPERWHIPYPTTVAEAMVCGKAVVATKIGGIPDLVENGKTGFLVDAGKDPSEMAKRLAEKINILLDKPKYAKNMGMRGKRRIEKICNPDLVAEKLIRCFEDAKNTSC